jgi:hypothetical protein
MLAEQDLQGAIMAVTKDPILNRPRRMGETVGRPKKGSDDAKPTRVMRLHADVVEMVEKLAPLFDLKAPEFASELLRPILEKKHRESIDRLKSLRMDPPAKSEKQ